MALKLVDEDYNFSLSIPLDWESRDSLHGHLLRYEGSMDGLWFEQKVARALLALVDGNLRAPAYKHLRRVVVMAKDLRIDIPSEALRFQYAYEQFIEEHQASHDALLNSSYR